MGDSAFKGGDLKGSISHWTRALEILPEARGLKADMENTKQLLRADEAIAKEDYATAHEALDKAKEYSLTKAGALELIKKMHSLADEHNRKGMRHYVAERIDRAIDEWRMTLKIFPGHERALANLADAQKLKEKMEGVR